MATLTKGIKLSEFASMSDEEKCRRVSELAQAAMQPTQEQLNNQKRKLDAEIQALVSRYKMSSSEMLCKLREGKLTETAEICSWLMLLRMRDRFESPHLPQPTRS